MNKHKIIKQGKKLLFSSIAAAVLGMICVTTKPVKAATVNGDYPSTNSVNTKKAELNYQAKNNAPTVKNDSAKFDSAKAAKSDTIETGTWDGIPVEYDTVTHTLTIGGGTINNTMHVPNVPNTLQLLRIDWNDPSYTYDTLEVKTINFTKKLVINGSAAEWFRFYNNLTTINGFENVDLTHATDMNSMFINCTALENIDLNKLFQPNKTYAVTNVAHMFEGCKKITNLDFSNFDTSNVVDMSGMFNGDINLTQLDLSKFNTSKVTNMNAMFSDCPKLTSIKGLDKFDTSKVTSMGQMFAYCSSLNKLDLSNFNTSKVTQFYFMFYRCTNLQNLNISSFDMTHANFNFNMFASLPNLNTLVLGESCEMANTGLDTPGTWTNMGNNGLIDKGTYHWTSDELVNNYDGSSDYDTYKIEK